MSNLHKILLVVPPLEGSAYSFSAPNLGLGYVGAALLDKGYEVKFLDMGLISNGFFVLQEIISSFKPEIIGVTGFTPHYNNMLRIAALAKGIDSSAIVVFGGFHASALGEFILESNPAVDFIIRGEGEHSFPRLVDFLNKKNRITDVQGLIYREGKEIKANPAESICDLDSLKYPWSIIKISDYQQGKVHGFICRRKPIVQVLSSRGCPYQCTFCAGRKVHGLKIRARNPGRFVDELEYLKKGFGICEFQIADDNFTFYRDHAMEVCLQIIKRKLNLCWSLPNGVRADRLDEELLLTMKRAGCYYLSFGIEFGSARMLKICKKSLDLEQAAASIKLASRIGFITQGFFLLGYPQETAEDIELTEKFIQSVPLDRILLIPPFPYPGSELFEYYLAKRFQGLDNIDWSAFRQDGFSGILEHLDQEYVFEKRLRMFRNFYSKPGNLIRFLSKFRTLTQVRSSLYGLQVFGETLRKHQ
jgi:radical SAM superfamily enzyme YgiQ (UPF0313 family)